MAAISKFDIKKLIALLLVSLLLSVAIIRTSSVGNVSFCVRSAGCKSQDPKGTVAVRSYGYPVTYKEVATFRPANSDEKSSNYVGYVETSVENKSLNVANIFINVAFWFGLLSVPARLIRQKQSAASTAPPAEPTTPTTV